MSSTSYREDLRRLLAVFHSPRRTAAEIGKAPSVGVVVAAVLSIFTVAAVARETSGLPTLGDPQGTYLLLVALVLMARPVVASALYLVVFNYFGAEARYRVILSVTLHAMWAIVVGIMVLGSLAHLLFDGPFLEIREFLISSIGLEEHNASRLAPMFQPVEICRLLLTGLGLAIALGTTRSMSLGIVFAGWIGFHAVPVLLLFHF